ncbi:hypothetical protein Tco_1400777 [Tanacetum coccineum]
MPQTLWQLTFERKDCVNFFDSSVKEDEDIVEMEELMQTQREAQQANELSNITRQRQLLANVNYRRAIIQELECLPRNLVACKTREHLKCIQKAIFVEVIELKKELRLQVPP